MQLTYSLKAVLFRLISSSDLFIPNYCYSEIFTQLGFVLLFLYLISIANTNIKFASFCMKGECSK